MPKVHWESKPKILKTEPEIKDGLLEQMIWNFDAIALHAPGSHECVIYHDVTNPEGRVETHCVLWRKNTASKWIVRTSYKNPIVRGDIICVDGQFWLVDDPVTVLECHSSYASLCNATVSVLRDIPDITDERGYFISPGTTKIIVAEQPCIIRDNLGDVQSSDLVTRQY